eukprot:jgi/Mesvir1/15817/Mv03373-RA.1
MVKVVRSEEELRQRREAQARYRLKHPEKAALQRMRAMAKKDQWTPTEKWLEKHGTDCEEVNEVRAVVGLPEKECKPQEAPSKPAPPKKTLAHPALWSLDDAKNMVANLPETLSPAEGAGRKRAQRAKGQISRGSGKTYLARLTKILRHLGYEPDKDGAKPVTPLLDTKKVREAVDALSEPSERGGKKDRAITKKTNAKDLFSSINSIDNQMDAGKRIPQDVREAYVEDMATSQEGLEANAEFVSENKPPAHPWPELVELRDKAVKEGLESDKALIGLLYFSGEELPPVRLDYHDARIVKSAKELGKTENGYIPKEYRFIINAHKTAPVLGAIDFVVPKNLKTLREALDMRKDRPYLFMPSRGKKAPMSVETFGAILRKHFHGVDNARQAFVTQFVMNAGMAARKRFAKMMAHSVNVQIQYERMRND